MTTPHLVELNLAPSIAALGVIALQAISPATYTPSDYTAFTIALAALIAAVFTGIVNIITAFRTTRKIDEAAVKTQEVKAAVEVVAGHVNSAATASVAKIDALQRQVEESIHQIAELKQIAALREQERLISRVLPSESMGVAVTPTETNLAKIEQNTRDTAATLADTLTHHIDKGETP